MQTITTRRLILRPFRDSDYDDLYEFLSQLENDEYEGYPGITYENVKEHLKYRVGSEEYYAIELQASGKVIGNIYCGNRNYENKEVGYIINRDYQKKGYGSEALSAVIANAFAEGAHRVFAECDPLNERSWWLLEKVRLRREAHLRENIYFRKDENGLPKWKDSFIYDITVNDFNNQRR